ncbi:hypothetical protein BDW68DRAFT_178751 [Aspergillus falconensis]
MLEYALSHHNIHASGAKKEATLVSLETGALKRERWRQWNEMGFDRGAQVKKELSCRPSVCLVLVLVLLSTKTSRMQRMDATPGPAWSNEWHVNDGALLVFPFFGYQTRFSGYDGTLPKTPEVIATRRLIVYNLGEGLTLATQGSQPGMVAAPFDAGGARRPTWWISTRGTSRKTPSLAAIAAAGELKTAFLLAII